jgi:hypothetical protein
MMTPSGVCRRRARNRTNYNSCANREGDQSFFITRPPLLRFDENRASLRFDVVRNARPTAFPSIGTGLALASVNDRLAVIGSDLTKRLPKLIAVMARRVRFCLLRGAVLGKTSTPVRSDSKRRTSMAVMLNRRAFEHAKELINEGRFVFDERDAWSEHRPSAQEENEFIRLHGFAEYGRWYLGINDEKPDLR